MFGLPPDLTPRDSHSIWYTSSRNPSLSPFPDPSGPDPHSRHQHDHQGNGGPPNNNARRAGQLLIERSQLARLRADEQHMERRRLNIQNFGATWVKPPGIPKTLHQMREERREAEEHAEAMRREQMQQEYAEAGAAPGVEEEEDDGESGVLDEMGDGARDLDEEIPDADALEMSGIEAEVSTISSDSDDDSDSDVSSSGDDASGGGAGAGAGRTAAAAEEEDSDDEARHEERRNELVQARMRMGDDAFRQALARGDADAGDMYGAEEELEAEGQGEMLLEDVFHGSQLVGDGNDDGMGGGDLDMDADLDGSIPEAGELSGVYEHTDSEAELSSSLPSSSSAGSDGQAEEEDDDEEGDEDMNFGLRSSAPLRAPDSPTLQARGDGARGHRAQRSLDLSSLLSGGDSSVLDSSPQRGPRR